MAMLSALYASTAFALSDMDGKAASFGQLAVPGKWTVVEIWASDCRACRASIHETIDFEASNPDVAVVGLSLDGETPEGKAKAQKFIDEFALDFNNLLNNPTDVDKFLYGTHKYSFIGTPTFVVYDPEGKLHKIQAGIMRSDALQELVKK